MNSPERLLFITGSILPMHEGIAAAAQLLFDGICNSAGREKVLLLTSDGEGVRERQQKNGQCQAAYLLDWKFRIVNLRTLWLLLKEHNIRHVHMEYPGDGYGKTAFPSFLPFLTKLFGLLCGRRVAFHIRLHEFSMARVSRKIAILVLLLLADDVQIPGERERKQLKHIFGEKIREAKIGSNIVVYPAERPATVTACRQISYFGSVYPGKGIRPMLELWSRLAQDDLEGKYQFVIIGEINSKNGNHFEDYHRQVEEWIRELNLSERIRITGYLDERNVSSELQKTACATLLYEDGLSLRRGSFLACLAHGVPIVTTSGDDVAKRLFSGLLGICMSEDSAEQELQVQQYCSLSDAERERIALQHKELAKQFSWEGICKEYCELYEL